MEPPFYAIEIHPGTLGTNGGPQIDRDGQVSKLGGGVVGGLYAAGNTAANVFGWEYPSGGGTIGNGMVDTATFGSARLTLTYESQCHTGPTQVTWCTTGSGTRWALRRIEPALAAGAACAGGRVVAD